MNKVEAQQRILRNLAVIHYQVEALSRNGQNISIYAETAIQDSLNAVTGLSWTNINASSNNFPAIDLISQDGIRGVQATLRTTKAKLDKTIDALVKELAKPTSQLTALRQVEVVGLTCVNNPTVTAWAIIKGLKHPVAVRGIDLETLLGLSNLSDVELADLDEALQALATTSPFHLRSDQEEMRTIIAFLDRPAIRDRRTMEFDWHAMQDAMLSVRRLIAQGTNDTGQQITRPYPTFQPRLATLLKAIYTESAAISALLRNELHSPGSMRESEWMLLEGHRRRIQEKVTELATEANIPAPQW